MRLRVLSAARNAICIMWLDRYLKSYLLYRVSNEQITSIPFLLYSSQFRENLLAKWSRLSRLSFDVRCTLYMQNSACYTNLNKKIFGIDFWWATSTLHTCILSNYIIFIIMGHNPLIELTLIWHTKHDYHHVYNNMHVLEAYWTNWLHYKINKQTIRIWLLWRCDKSKLIIWKQNYLLHKSVITMALDRFCFL